MFKILFHLTTGDKFTVYIDGNTYDDALINLYTRINKDKFVLVYINKVTKRYINTDLIKYIEED